MTEKVRRYGFENGQLRLRKYGTWVRWEDLIRVHDAIKAEHQEWDKKRVKEIEDLRRLEGLWRCGCGWTNGPSLATCASCGRTPHEGQGVQLDDSLLSQGLIRQIDTDRKDSNE